MTGTTIIETIVSSFTSFLTGIGSAIVTFFDNVFTTTDGKLTTLAIVMLSFMGLGLAAGIVKWVQSKF